MIEPKRKPADDEEEEWLGRNADAKWQDTKIEEVIERLDESRLDRGMNGTPDPL